MLRGITFGQCRFETETSRIEPDADVHFGLVLLLAAADTDGLAREEIVRVLWPRGDDGGRHCLRQTLYRLRQLGIRLRARAGRVALAGDDVSCDLHDLLHGEPTRDQMIRLGTLPFLPAYAPKLGDAFREWLETLRGRVSGRLRQILAAEVGVARANARFHEVGRIARALLAQDPLNEIGTLGLAESMALEGSKVEALRMLEEYEEEVGEINEALRIAPRTLRRRVSECLDDALLPRRFDVPFVGREAEYTALRTAYQEARNGAARCAVLTGEAGMGKTRLASEVMRLAALDGTTAASYAASAGDSFTPISTLVSVGHLLLSLPGALGCAHEHLQYVRRLGTPETVSVWSATGMAADIAYAQLVHALAELVRALADEAPLILFIDDAQRLHQTSWRILFDVLDRVRDARVLLVLATRRLPPWFGSVCRDTSGHVTRNIRLAPFSADDSQTFMRHWSDKNRVSMPEADELTCATTSAGNPFYLGELAAHVARGGDLRMAPKSIRELIELQHAALGKGAQRLLLVIALFEGRATLGRVTQVMELGADEFMSALDEIEEAGLIAAKGPVLRCKHELVAETAVGLAMEGVQTFARDRIAELLEQEADATNSVELLGDCLTHWERAGEMRRAYLAAMKLGSRLVGLGMGTEAERAYERALAVAESPAERVDSYQGLMVALHLSAKWHAIRFANEKRAVLINELRRRISGFDRYDLLAIEGSMWEHSHSTSAGDLQAIAEDPYVDIETRSQAIMLAAMLADSSYDRSTLFQLRSITERLGSTMASWRSAHLTQLVYCCSIGSMIDAGEMAVQLARSADISETPCIKIQDLRRAGAVLLRVGRIRDGAAYLEQALALAEELKLPLQAFACREHLVRSSLLIGEHEAAREHFLEMRPTDVTPSLPYLDAMRRSAAIRILWETRASDFRFSYDTSIAASFDSSIASSKHLIQTDALAVQLMRPNGVLDTGLISTLVGLHRRARAFGDKDYHLEVLLHALMRLGRYDLAVALCDQYLVRHRRGVSPPPLGLLELAASMHDPNTERSRAPKHETSRIRSNLSLMLRS